MADVGDFEDLLAALDDAPSKMTLQHSQGHAPRIAADHQNLSQMHTNSSLPVIQDQINFDSLQQHGLQLGHNQHMGTTQMMVGLEHGMGGMSRNDILANNVIEDAFSSHVEQSDQSAVQAGSSLGSLFLDSVDEMLSNEKTPQSAGFASPNVQPVAAKPHRPKVKKPVPHKSEKMQSHTPAAIEQTMHSSQQLIGGSSIVAMKADDQGLVRSVPGNAYNPGSKVSTMMGQQQEAFSRIYRQQGTQLPRPQSNTSCESSFYPGSVPQPSPSGDSNLTPRTPHSNNPLTPQSVIQPNTPQSNQLTQQANRSTSATPLVQMQQHGLLNEAPFLQMGTSPPPPVIPDDQSHLQYLNTTPSISQPNVNDISIDDGLLDDLPTPVKSMFQDKFSIPDFASFHIPSSESTPQASVPQQLWPQRTMNQSHALTIGQTHHLANFKQPKQVIATGFAPGTQQMFASVQTSAEPTNFQQPAFIVSTSSNQASFMGYPNDNRSIFSNSSANYTTGLSDGLSLTQSKILDNHMEWGKLKQKSTVAVSKGQPSQSSAHQQSSAGVSYSQNAYQTAKPNSSESGSTSNNTVLNMLSSAECEIKQIFSQPPGYEAVSPISDYSPVHKDPSDMSLNENASSNATVMGAQGQLPTSSITLQKGLTHSRLREGEEKLKAGPLARRRSASNEQKQSQNATKKVESGEFNFVDEDEFGFDQNEPTIRLPTKRAESNENSNPKQAVPNEMARPILASTIQRENYSDPSLFDSVKELAILNEKRQSLMSKLQASRNLKTLPQKPSRVTPKVSGSNKASYAVQQQAVNKRSSTTITKPSRPRKPSKSETLKESSVRPSTKLSSNQLPKSQNQKEKLAKPDESSIDIFYEQFLNQAINATKSDTAVNDKVITSNAPSVVSESSMFPGRSSANPEDTRPAQQSRLSSTMNMSGQIYTGHRVSGSGMFEIPPARGPTDGAHFQMTAKINQPSPSISTFQSANSENKTSMPLPLRSNDGDAFMDPKASKHPTIPLTSSGRKGSKDQDLHKSFPSRFQSTIKANTHSSSEVSYQPVSTTNSNALLQMYINSTSMDSQSSFSSGKNTDAMAYENPQNKAQIASAKSVSTLTPTFSSISSSSSTAAKQSASPNVDTQLLSSNQRHLDFLQSLLAKQPVEVTSTSSSLTTTSTTHIGNSRHAHSIPGVGPGKTSSDRFPILPDMSQIQFDYTTTSSLTSTVSVFPTVSHPTQRFPLVSSSASSWPVVSSATTMGSSHSKNNPLKSSDHVQTTSSLPFAAVDTLSQSSKKPDIKSTSHTISHLPDPANIQHLPGTKRTDLTSNYSLPPGHDPLSFGNFLNAPYVGGADRFSSQMPPNQAAVQQSLELLRLTQQRLEKQSAEKAFSSVHFSPSVCTANATTNSTSTTSKSVTLPTYQQSMAGALSSIYGNLQPQQNSAKIIESPSTKPQQELNLAQLSCSTSTHSRALSREGGTYAAPDHSVANLAKKMSAPLDFSSKTSGSEISLSSSLVESSVNAPSSVSQIHVLTKTTSSDPSPLTSTTNILKDKTYHGPKKKHILEKYCQQTQQSSASSVPQKSKVLHVPKLNEDRSGKGRKASADKTTLTQARNETFTGNLTTQLKSSHKTSNHKNAQSGTNENKTASSNGTLRNATRGKVANPNDSKKSAQQSSSKSNKDEQSGSSIFSLFDSLLQEAAESAKGSLKNDQGKKKDKNQGKTTKATENDSKQNTKKAKESAKNKEVLISSNAKEATEDNSTVALSQNDLVTPISPTLTTTTVGTTSTVTSNTTNTTASRTPANFPFKRRHFHTQKKDTSDVPIAILDTSTSKTTSVEPVITLTTQTSASVTNISVTSTTANANECKLATSTASSSNISQLPLKHPDYVPSPVKENEQPTIGGLKLKITAFRSSGGMVIHQSTALGDLIGDDAQSDDSRRSRKKKKRKYKKEKKRRQTSSSSESSDSSLPLRTLSKVTPPAPVVSSLFFSGNDSDAYQTNLPDAISSFNSSVDSATGSGSTSTMQKRKKKINRTMRQPALKRQLINMASDVSSEPKKQKQTGAKKVPNKSVPRYKLKTTRTQAPSGEDVTMSFNRAPGRPPLYLNAGANQTLVSGSSQSVPTIQLLPRTTIKTAPKAVANIPAVTSQSAAKLLSGKLSAKTVKAVQAHVVPKSTVAGVRYLLPTTKPVSNVPISPRIIIPKLSSPSFSVGKATVFTVSSSGARVSGTPSIQIQPTPVQTSSSIGFSVVSPTQPVIVKRIPLSLLPKVTVSPSSSQKAGDSAAPTNAMSTLSSVVSFTSKPIQLSSKVVAPKPFFSSASTALSLKVSTNISKSPTASVIAEALEAAASRTHSKNSREQEFQSAFSKLISSPSPLNKYTPPPIPPQYLDLPACSELKTEQCFECGDVFYFRSSLQHHYDRRSIVVKVRCVQCNQMLVFFNKCEILRHAREHSDHGEVMQFNGANLSPIPLSLCKPRTKEFFRKAAQEKVEFRKSSDQKTTGCAMACTECSFVTDGNGTLEDHFQRRNANLRTCDICKLPLHNQCVFSAHMRMHRHASPHTCPECGQTFDGDKMEFNLHLRIQCFHLSRASCYKCKLCNLTFLTDDQLRHHLRLNHVQVFYKCRECPMAFKTTQNIANHQRSAHNLTPEPTNTLKTIYKCPLCDTVFTDSSHSQQLFVLLKHFDSHINSTRITAYKCYLCTSLFEQKAPLREHLQNEHKVSSLNEMAAYAVEVDDDKPKPLQIANVENETKQGSDNKRPSRSAKRPNADQKQKETSVKPQVKLKRLKLDDSLTSSKTPSSDEKRSKRPFKLRIKGMSNTQSKTRYPSSDDHDDDRDDDNDDGDDDGDHVDEPSPLLPAPKRKLSVIKTAQGKKSYPCPECEKVFQSSHSRSSHIRCIHRGIRALYCCTRCPVGSTKYAKRITLVKHLKKAHSVSTVQKDDVKIVRTHRHYLSPGTKFKASAIEVDKHGVVTPEKQKKSSKSLHPEKKLPRKKITSRHPVQARAKRLAAVAGNRMRMKMKKRKRSCSDESEESYGEVDEKMVEEGWSFDEEDPEPNEENDDIEEIDPSMFNFPDIYNCIKCDYQHGDRLVFQAHITEHSESLDAASALTMVQCTECGLSFASSASLDKHLHIKHKIKRRHLLERYDAKLRAARENEPLSDSNTDISAAGGSKTNVFRCKVCFHKFDAETELKTHMRTHGLAFVKSKQH